MTTSEPKRPLETDRLVGSRIRTGRIMAGMSQEDLAAAIGLSFQQVQKYETGVNRISSGRLRQIAEALGVSVPYLFGVEANGAGSCPPDRLTVLLADGGLALLEAFYQVRDAKGRQAILEIVKCMARSAR